MLVAVERLPLLRDAYRLKECIVEVCQLEAGCLSTVLIIALKSDTDAYGYFT